MPALRSIPLVGLLFFVLLACGKESASTQDDGGNRRTATGGAKRATVKERLNLDALVPPGAGWKCVYEHCRRDCVYPRQARTERPPPLPPCNDRETAFCYAQEYSAPNPPGVVCFTDLETCEASRHSGHPDFATSACAEKK